jgi:hypothetical protein
VQVLYETTDPELPKEAQILAHDFPKNVAISFGSVWKNQLANHSEANTRDQNVTVSKEAVTIVGGHFQVAADMLKWMLSCCEGRGLRWLPIPDKKPFAWLLFLRELAEQIGCGYLVGKAREMMDRIGGQQVRSEDVRTLWTLSAADSNARRFLTAHVGLRFWERRLRAVEEYKRLRAELPDFDDAINNFCEEKRSEVKTKQLEAQKKQEAARAEQRTAQEQNMTTTTLQCQVVRQRNARQSAWVRLDLGAAGVTRADFVGKK